jgi:hypothetical protein
VKLNRIIRKRLRSADGRSSGDLHAALAVNVGEAGGSHAHVSSHTRIVQSTRGSEAQKTTTVPPPEPGDPKETA